LEYLQELLTRLDGAFKVSERSADEQERLCRRLGEAGIRTSIAYASREGADEVEYIFVEGEPLDKHLNTLGDEDAAEINSLVLQHQRFVTIAHDVGVVVGDRWPGNAIVSQGRVTLIDFAIGYSGNFKDLCCCEELFSLFQCLSFLRTASVRDDLAGRLCPAISKRHGRRAGAIWEKLSDFYTNPRKPSTPTSLPQERYVVTADSFDRFL
jgi:tRNA A-37 threonylcarbamoyl transferase component Bud32